MHLSAMNMTFITKHLTGYLFVKVKIASFVSLHGNQSVWKASRPKTESVPSFKIDVFCLRCKSNHCYFYENVLLLPFYAHAVHKSKISGKREFIGISNCHCLSSDFHKYWLEVCLRLVWEQRRVWTFK